MRGEGLPWAMRRSSFASLPLLFAVLLAGCTIESEYDDGPGPDDTEVAGGGRTVRLVDDAFEPDAVAGAVGDTFRFVNDGASVHTVTVVIAGDDAERLDRELLPGQETSFSPDRETVYTVYCKYHGSPDGGMRATVDTT